MLETVKMSSSPRRLLIIGAGGAGLEALLVAQRAQNPVWEIIGFADDGVSTHGQSVGDFKVLGAIPAVLAALRGQKVWFHCGIGRNAVRRELALMAEGAGLKPATLVDRSAVVAESARLGDGSYVAPHAFVGPMAVVGRHVLINVGASVGHHAVVGDYAQLCPGARVSGKAELRTGAFVGSNGVLAPGVVAGEGANIGAGSFAARDVPGGATALGVPAKMLAAPIAAP